ncbi:MAG: RNA 2',3'-cyclic phosphodiesterase [Burkholderiaceae bacterium]
MNSKQANAQARLFLALWPDQAAQAKLTDHVRQWRWSDAAQRYGQQDWHVTLHFIGSVPRQRLAELRAGLAVPVLPFALQLRRPEIWRQGLALLAPETVPENLLLLQAELGLALKRLGLPTEDRVFRPHLTLARRAAGSQAPTQVLDLGWTVKGYSLVESTGDPLQRYRQIEHFGHSRIIRPNP